MGGSEENQEIRHASLCSLLEPRCLHVAERNSCLVGLLRLAVAGSLFALSGCIGFFPPDNALETELAAGRPEVALQALEDQFHSPKDEVLYLLNKGMLLRMSGQLIESNAALEQAKQRMKKLYAVSISEQITSFVINDATKSYVGDEYEQILVYVYKALNYLEMDKSEKARVEVMQMDVRLTELGKAAPTLEAFGRYIAGMVFESRHEWSDAMVAYRKAYEAYKRPDIGENDVPQFLQHDLLRLAQRQGLRDEVRQYKEEFGIEKWQSVADRSGRGELIMLIHNDLAPKKHQASLFKRDRSSGHLVRISIPFYPEDYVSNTEVYMDVDGKSVMAKQIEDINAAARSSLETKKPAIIARAIARAVIKAEIARKAREESRKNNQPLLGLLVEIGTIFTERADTRSWSTLPNNVHMARVSLAPGTYNVRTDIKIGFGRALHTRAFDNVQLKKGGYRFINYHWVSPGTHRRR